MQAACHVKGHVLGRVYDETGEELHDVYTTGFRI